MVSFPYCIFSNLVPYPDEIDTIPVFHFGNETGIRVFEDDSLTSGLTLGGWGKDYDIRDRNYDIRDEYYDIRELHV